jgi:hypothetical protein
VSPITSLNAEALADLRQRLLAAVNFDQFWTYYFDHFAEHPDLYHLSDRIDAPGAVPVIEEAAARLMGHPHSRARGIQLFQIQGSDMYHGSCSVGGRLSAFLYFSSIHSGMLAVVGESDEMHYCRFRMDPGAAVPAGAIQAATPSPGSRLRGSCGIPPAA